MKNGGDLMTSYWIKSKINLGFVNKTKAVGELLLVQLKHSNLNETFEELIAEFLNKNLMSCRNTGKNIPGLQEGSAISVKIPTT